jgi:hypothetical protein
VRRAQRGLRILVSGMIATVPYQGGATWAVLQYVLGLRRLGHDVCFVESIAPELIRPGGARLADSEQGRYFAAVSAQFDLGGRAALIESRGADTVGMSGEEVQRFADHADMVFNLSGVLRDERLLAPVPLRVFVDLDPAFTQMWHAGEGIDFGFANHNRFVTIGMNIGRSDCPVPTCGLPWIVTPQPIVLERWPACDPSALDRDAAFTTIANWRAYGSITYDGVFYGQKAHSLRPLIALPASTGARFLLALSIHPEEARDIAMLAANGWERADPRMAAGDAASYAAFIRSSRAEFGVAKRGYAASRCGWFSDRSLCYLASGRPVLAQETGFTRWLAAGEGIVAFSLLEDARTGVDAILGDYARHARAARAIAEGVFDSDRVLPALLERIGRSA